MGHNKNNKKKIIPVLILVVVLAGSYYYFGRNAQNFIGVVEATVLPHTSEVSGKILEMPIALGSHVTKGDVIAKIDSSAQEYAYEQLELTLEKKKIALADLSVGAGGSQAENSLAIAKSNYSSSVSSNEKASSDYKNAQALFNQGAISQDALDLSRVKAESAANASTAAKALLDNARSKSPSASMDLDIELTESQLHKMKEDLDKYTILAASNGVVMSKSYMQGDMVAPGYNLADIAADGEKYFMFYLPIDYLNTIGYDKTYTVTSGTNSYKAVVKYIDVESEYTPKDMQTAANKNRESVKIKLLLPKDCPLKPGQEAKIKLEKTEYSIPD